MLRVPRGRQMRHNGGVHDGQAVMGEDHQYGQQLAPAVGTTKKIDRHDLADVIGQKRVSRLRRRTSSPRCTWRPLPD
jgi:hypothetical protein